MARDAQRKNAAQARDGRVMAEMTHETRSGTTRPPGRIASLDGWRGIGILLVVIDHAGERSTSHLMHAVTRVGATGVGLFFALSGYIITLLLLRERQDHGTINLKGFYLRRVFRLAPPVIVYLFVLALLHARELLPVTRQQMLSSLLLYRNYIPSDWGAGWYTGHFWSLTVEEHFYLLWPALLLLIRGNVAVVAVLALLDALWRGVSFHLHLLPYVWPPGRTDVRLDSLLWGCVLAMIQQRAAWWAKLKQWLSAPLLIGLLALDIVANLLHGAHDYSFFEPAILTLLVAWPILHDSGVVARCLRHPLLLAIGRISYSLYIWQQFWLLYPETPLILPRLQHGAAAIAMSFLCAVCSYFLVERPCIAAGRRLSRRWTGYAYS